MSINNLDQKFLKSLTVLYVEDDEETREQFSEFLRRPIGTLITAENGETGLKAFVEHAPNIIITDILMPVMDGLTMAHEIRKLSPEVPIIVITAFEQTDYLMRAINIGIDRFATKPVNSYLLFESLLECAHRLRGEELLRNAQQREIEVMRMKFHQTVATLAGGVAHDYNNLLQSLFSFIGLASMKADKDSQVSNFLAQAQTLFPQAQKLHRLLHLFYNTNEDAKQQTPILPFFRQVLEQSLEGSSVSLKSIDSDNQAVVRFVEDQMRVLAESLVANAIDFMPEGGALELTAQDQDVLDQDDIPLTAGHYLHMTLCDTGPGIAADVLPKIFDPYFSTKPLCSQKGMGLSLAIAQTIVMKHGGLITATSVPGTGTCMHIWLPVCDAQAHPL